MGTGVLCEILMAGDWQVTRQKIDIHQVSGHSRVTRARSKFLETKCQFSGGGPVRTHGYHQPVSFKPFQPLTHAADFGNAASIKQEACA